MLLLLYYPSFLEEQELQSKALAVDKVSDVIKTTEKTYQTYTKYNPKTGEVYSGRTSGTGTPKQNVQKRDVNHHMDEQGFGPAQLEQTSTNSDAIRGQEQYLIDKNGGAKSQGGTSGNKINGVNYKNSKSERYEDSRKRI